jgi:hypothetical protein
VGVALFLGEWSARLYSGGGILHGAVEGGPSCPEPERGNHQPGISEHQLRLHQALALLRADEVLGQNKDVVEEERRRIARADAMLVFGLAVGESLRALFHDEPGRSTGR